jgi:1-acyl-sn-glycerol-3-phosphate acyltransferase
MLNLFLKTVYKLAGWKNIGNGFPEIKKAVYAVCPHNTWLDVPVGLGSRAALGLEVNFLGKEELFKGMFSWFFYGLGGKPLIRNKNMNQVEIFVASFKEYDTLRLAMAPEGTRKGVPKLKSGFYYVAHQAGVPIIRVSFDFKNKEVTFAEPFMPTGDFKADMLKYFVPFFMNIHGQNDWIENYKKGIFE